MIIVDTNVWSELTKSPGSPRVLRWLKDNEEQLWLSSIVIAEIRMGAELPKAAAWRDRLVRWLHGLEDRFADQILGFDAPSAHIFGALRAKRPKDSALLDLQIAAQGIAYDAIVATRNVKDFAWTGAKLVNPWEGGR